MSSGQRLPLDPGRTGGDELADEFDDDDLRSRVPAFVRNEKGVPMGGDLRNATSDAPRFMVFALRDPIGANLDRIRIVKGWMDASGDPDFDPAEAAFYARVLEIPTPRRVVYVGTPRAGVGRRHRSAINPRDPDRLYAATWQRHRNVAAYMGGGPGALPRSVDGGRSWEKLTERLPTHLSLGTGGVVQW